MIVGYLVSNPTRFLTCQPQLFLAWAVTRLGETCTCALCHFANEITYSCFHLKLAGGSATCDVRLFYYHFELGSRNVFSWKS